MNSNVMQYLVRKYGSINDNLFQAFLDAVAKLGDADTNHYLITAKDEKVAVSYPDHNHPARNRVHNTPHSVKCHLRGSPGN